MAGDDYKRNCGICTYFKNAEILGNCRRYPKPITKHRTDWCGEFKEVEFAVSVAVYDINTDQVLTAPKKRGRPRK